MHENASRSNKFNLRSRGFVSLTKHAFILGKSHYSCGLNPTLLFIFNSIHREGCLSLHHSRSDIDCPLDESRQQNVDWLAKLISFCQELRSHILLFTFVNGTINVALLLLTFSAVNRPQNRLLFPGMSFSIFCFTHSVEILSYSTCNATIFIFTSSQSSPIRFSTLHVPDLCPTSL